MTVFLCGGHSEATPEEVEKFREFLRIAGPPPIDRQRFIDAGREDLLEWALCNEPIERPT